MRAHDVFAIFAHTHALSKSACVCIADVVRRLFGYRSNYCLLPGVPTLLGVSSWCVCQHEQYEHDRQRAPTGATRNRFRLANLLAAISHLLSFLPCAFIAACLFLVRAPSQPSLWHRSIAVRANALSTSKCVRVVL